MNRRQRADTDAAALEKLRKLTGDPSVELEDVRPDAVERVKDLMEEIRADMYPDRSIGEIK